jgi:hypothetical protein
MQEIVLNRKIKNIINFLRVNLPEQPTAVKTLYILPPKFAEDVIKSDYSLSSLQKISDHIDLGTLVQREIKKT